MGLGRLETLETPKWVIIIHCWPPLKNMADIGRPGKMSQDCQIHGKTMTANRTVWFSADAILLQFQMTEAGYSIQALQKCSFSSGSPFLSSALSGKRATLMQRVKVVKLGNVTDFHLHQWDQGHILINESHQYSNVFWAQGSFALYIRKSSKFEWAFLVLSVHDLIYS